MRLLRSAPLLLLALGVLLGLGYLVLHLQGWRQYATVLSGTFPSGNRDADTLRAFAYIASYFGAVVAAPILAIAAMLLAILERLFLKRPDAAA